VKASIVIPNYNGKKLLAAHLAQVIRHAAGFEIIIVDDGSTDGSASFIKTDFPDVKVIELAQNRGFSTAVNIGVKAATSEVVVLLNTDIVPQAGFLEQLLPHFQDPQVFAVGCLDESAEKGGIEKRGRGIGSFTRGFLHHRRGSANDTNTLWASGGSSAFSKKLWTSLGGMDPLYNPFYWEDIDLSYRALKSGYRVLFEARSVVRHEHDVGSIKTQFSPGAIKRIAYRNQIIFVWKNITDSVYLLQHFVWLPYHFVSAVIKGDWQFILGLFDALLQLPWILTQRRHLKLFYRVRDEDVLASIRHE
jgi:GT2 family glycosyltransferase